MSKERRVHSDEFKKKVVLEILREDRTLSELGEKYNIHPQVLTNWKSIFIKNAELVFNPDKKVKEYQKRLQESEKEKDQLYRQVGKLSTQMEWIKKKSEEYGFRI